MFLLQITIFQLSITENDYIYIYLELAVDVDITYRKEKNARTGTLKSSGGLPERYLNPDTRKEQE